MRDSGGAMPGCAVVSLACALCALWCRLPALPSSAPVRARRLPTVSALLLATRCTILVCEICPCAPTVAGEGGAEAAEGGGGGLLQVCKDRRPAGAGGKESFYAFGRGWGQLGIEPRSTAGWSRWAAVDPDCFDLLFSDEPLIQAVDPGCTLHAQARVHAACLHAQAAGVWRRERVGGWVGPCKCAGLAGSSAPRMAGKRNLLSPNCPQTALLLLQVGNFRVEPPGLFRGRGEHPKVGGWPWVRSVCRQCFCTAFVSQIFCA